MDWKVITLRDNVYCSLQVAKVEIWRYTLGIEVQSEGDEINISGSFAISEETAFNTVSSSQDTKLCSCDTGSWEMSVRDDEIQA